MTASQPTADLLDVPAAAAYLSQTVPWIRRRIYLREIPFHKLGATVRFRRADLDAYIDANRVEAAAS